MATYIWHGQIGVSCAQQLAPGVDVEGNLLGPYIAPGGTIELPDEVYQFLAGCGHQFDTSP